MVHQLLLLHSLLSAYKNEVSETTAAAAATATASASVSASSVSASDKVKLEKEKKTKRTKEEEGRAKGDGKEGSDNEEDDDSEKDARGEKEEAGEDEDEEAMERRLSLPFLWHCRRWCRNGARDAQSLLSAGLIRSVQEFSELVLVRHQAFRSVVVHFVTWPLRHTSSILSLGT